MNRTMPEQWRLAVMFFAAGAVVVAVLLHLVLGGPQAGPAEPSSTAASTPATTRSTPRAPTPHAMRNDPASGTARQAEGFARRAVSIVFDWDTTADTPESVTTQLLAVADPTGEETPGLLADLPAYLPDEAWWQRLREYETRQWLHIDVAEVPAAWTAAAGAGQLGDLRPGTTAVTVRGVRHRSGTVAGRTQATTHPVVLTVFVLCEPATDDCRLLRLGAPGKVLE
ncbi:hypothetical protein [Antribacter gilvus]|uniref:hypothetical protein n=1 Tax=Antribacter gilvus TaxID=2304675 RepID=UPI000F78D7EE|nr:hypothetical protein [Antribacter gilvus]